MLENSAQMCYIEEKAKECLRTMKRLISFIAAAVMMFTMSVSAAGLDFLKEEYKSYESAAELSFTLNKPIDFLDVWFWNTVVDQIDVDLVKVLVVFQKRHDGDARHHRIVVVALIKNVENLQFNYFPLA